MYLKKGKTDYLARFQPEAYYHVFTRTNNNEIIFKTDEYRTLFLNKYQDYLSDYVDTYAWCLMGNHFHLLVRIKSAEIITQNILQIPEIKRVLSHRHFLALPEEDRDFHSVIERQFTRLFTSFAMIFNHAQQRRGNLFYRPFKRVEVGDENHLIWLVYYIHSNPKKHGILKRFQQYRWSSYATFLSDSTTNLMRTVVLEWFCGLERFISFHTEENDLPENSMYLAIDQ